MPAKFRKHSCAPGHGACVNGPGVLLVSTKQGSQGRRQGSQYRTVSQQGAGVSVPYLSRGLRDEKFGGTRVYSAISEIESLYVPEGNRSFGIWIPCHIQL